MNELSSKNKIIATGLVVLLALYFCLVQSALSGPFVFDDFPNLENLQILNNGLNSHSLGRYLAAFTGSPGRPIAALSFLINDYAWPSNPYGFKYTNVLIHLLNGVLLFGLLRQLAKAAPEIMPQSPLWPLLTSAAWLFHPLQLSAQMLVVQRMTLLSASFCLIGLWAYTALLMRAKNAPGVFMAIAALGACTILAFLCKENGALLPLLTWVLNATLLHDVLAGKSKLMQRLTRAACIIPSAMLFAAIAYMATRPGTFESREFGLMERLMTQTHVLADYVRHILIPRLSGSGIYFDDFPVYRTWTQPISTLLLAAGIIAGLVLAIVKGRTFPILGFAILWFFAGHAMESSILDLELYFEHRNYLPLLGPVVALSAWAFSYGPRRTLGIGLFSLWLALLMAITALQAPVWGNARLLTTLWAKERPMSLRATQELAKFQYDQGQVQAAADTLMDGYHRGIAYADLPMTSLLAQCWRPEIHSAVDLYQESLRSIRSSPYSNSVLKSLLLLRQAAQEDVCPKTITTKQWLAMSDALLANPKFLKIAESHIRIERAKLYTHERNLDLTMNELERAYAVAPTVELSQKIAETLLSAGLVDDAEVWLKKGLQLKQPYFDRLMNDPTQHSRQILQQIEQLYTPESAAIPPGK
jgi:tetratricopeptide (TPR) repeat protein